MLCRFFLDKFIIRLGIEVQGVAPTVMDLLMQYEWPGNVRELENVLERALILTDKNIILPEHLPLQFGTYSLKKGLVRRICG